MCECRNRRTLCLLRLKWLWLMFLQNNPTARYWITLQLHFWTQWLSQLTVEVGGRLIHALATDTQTTFLPPVTLSFMQVKSFQVSEFTQFPKTRKNVRAAKKHQQVWTEESFWLTSVQVRSAVSQGQNDNEDHTDLGVAPHLSWTSTNGRPHSVIGSEGTAQAVDSQFLGVSATCTQVIWVTCNQSRGS